MAFNHSVHLDVRPKNLASLQHVLFLMSKRLNGQNTRFFYVKFHCKSMWCSRHLTFSICKNQVQLQHSWAVLQKSLIFMTKPISQNCCRDTQWAYHIHKLHTYGLMMYAKRKVHILCCSFLPFHIPLCSTSQFTTISFVKFWHSAQIRALWVRYATWASEDLEIHGRVLESNLCGYGERTVQPPWTLWNKGGTQK